MEIIDLKNKLSTIAGILGGLAGIDLALAQYGIVAPQWVHVICGIFGTISVIIIGILQGRNADGSKKTPEQLETQKQVEQK